MLLCVERAQPLPHSLVFVGDPQSFLDAAQVPPPWRSRAADAARVLGPQEGTMVPATLPGPLSLFQRAAP